ncbi:putative membrane protein [Lysobacter dokdonensis DS-58]|uniref:Putative membrane protein n=1 Tax=Lysobacter dokdonensis DS-58 TaxID=1300345 RepID=A0A0A2X0Q3_9GAMM|nr:AI-2E family transporter [Lysobacter dokdonensis]KGQ18804.1 putative membrane protein [Lysobacter dokdonensis DS-58]
MHATTLRRLLTTDLSETLLRVALIGLLIVVCVRVFTPFSHLVIIAMILAVALYPLYLIVLRWFGGRRRLTATVLVLFALLAIGAPIVALGVNVAGQLSDTYHAVEEDRFALPAPDARVRQWPIVGARVHATWSAASDNLPTFLQQNREVVRGFARKTVPMAAGGLKAVALFLLAIVVAGVMLVHANAEERIARRIVTRLTDEEQGPELLALSVATMRSVATGVVGVAFIQALMLGVGFLLAGVPGAGVLALIALFIGILQLPALLVSLPAVVWLWMSDDGGSTLSRVLFTAWFVIAGAADNVLKPMLLGRGVDAPMLVILVGAIGGMVVGGMTGLFLGAVLLTVGYRIFMQWVDRAAPPPAG